MTQNKGRSEKRASGTDMGCACGDHCTCKDCTCSKSGGSQTPCSNCGQMNCDGKQCKQGAAFLKRLRSR